MVARGCVAQVLVGQIELARERHARARERVRRVVVHHALDVAHRRLHHAMRRPRRDVVPRELVEHVVLKIDHRGIARRRVVRHGNSSAGTVCLRELTRTVQGRAARSLGTAIGTAQTGKFPTRISLATWLPKQSFTYRAKLKDCLRDGP
eukprot:4581610-Prymnesium_polylepis.2